MTSYMQTPKQNRTSHRLLGLGRLFLFLLTCFILSGPVKADRLDEAATLVQSLLEDLSSPELADNSLSAEDKQSRLSDILDTYFDIDGITRFTVGRYWRTASPAQREEYTKLFKTVLISEASTRFDQIMHFDFRLMEKQPRGDKLILISGVVHDNSNQIPDTKMVWRIASEQGKSQKIIDIEIENISMLKTQQDENTALIRRNGGDFSILIEAMRAKIKDIHSAKTG